MVILDLYGVATQSAAETIEPDHLGFACDVRDEAVYKATVQQIISALGQIDMLSQVRSSGLEIFINLGIIILFTLVPQISIHGLGCTFPDHAAVCKTMDGGLGN